MLGSDIVDNYVDTIKIAILVFPLVAFMISAPFILIQYHKYGSLSFLRALIIYSLVLYLICAYFLVILPLPKISEVALMTSRRVQLIPFSFVGDFIRETSFNITNIHTYLLTLKERCFFVPVYNIIITIPFGMYLRYYYKCNLKKTVLFSFLLSLFFELTQLSGLYFIYPRGYRLFDVDDLILNTLGGLLGYFISKPFISLLPKRDEIDEESIEKGKTISGFRRTTSLFFDFFIVGVIYIIFTNVTNIRYIFIYIVLVYYFIIPVLLGCRTLGEKFLNIKITDLKSKKNVGRYLLRNTMFILLYFVIPYLLYKILYSMNINDVIFEICGLAYFASLFIFYLITGIKYLFTNKSMIYEKMSKTKLVSTIK